MYYPGDLVFDILDLGPVDGAHERFIVLGCKDESDDELVSENVIGLPAPFESEDLENHWMIPDDMTNEHAKQLFIDAGFTHQDFDF